MLLCSIINTQIKIETNTNYIIIIWNEGGSSREEAQPEHSLSCARVIIIKYHGTDALYLLKENAVLTDVRKERNFVY